MTTTNSNALTTTDNLTMLATAEKMFKEALHGIGNAGTEGEKFASRELSTAATKIDEGVMWAKRHIEKNSPSVADNNLNK